MSFKNTFAPAKFCHYIYADFCRWSSNILSSLYFVSRAATVWMYHRKVERRNTTVWMFSRHRNFKVRNDFAIARDFPRFKGLDVTVMKVFWWVEKQLYAGPESAFVASLLSIHSSHLYCQERAGWGRKNWPCPRTQEPLGTPLDAIRYCYCTYPKKSSRSTSSESDTMMFARYLFCLLSKHLHICNVHEA